MIRQRFLVLIFICAASLAFGAPLGAHAQSAAELQAQIDANNRQLETLKAEILQYQKEGSNVLDSKKSTLQSAVNSLALSQKQLATQIKVTQNQIASANLQIQELSLSIGDKEEIIAADRSAIAKALRTIAINDERPIVVQLISSESLADTWQAIDQIQQFDRALIANINDLRAARTELVSNRDKVAATKAGLVALQNQLTLQKRSVDASKLSQQQLLTQTKSQETNYQKLVAQKQAAEKSFEQELINLQGQLNLIVNPNLLPKVGSGVLSWPFSIGFMNGCAQRVGVFKNLFCITQYFGNTAFSTANPQIYNGNGHNAIDIATPIGTPVRAALGGTVLATGNTDLVSGCYSFGKWVMVIHGNGLNTMYSHLSVIDVQKGQAVSTGQVLGLSGMTGYATGPHLHFGVYATDGTQITTLKQFRGAKSGCADASMPVATLKAYLNPLSYL